MATIANLDVNLRAQTQKYENGLKRAGQSTNRFTDRTRMAAKGTQSFQAKLTSFATKGLVAVGVIAGISASVNRLVQNFAKLGDEIGKAAARTQLSTDDFQTLSFAFEQSGGSAQNLETAIRSMSTQYLDLQRGTATSTDLFNRLGLTLSELQGLDVGNQFRLIAKSVANIRDPLERAAVATKLFGRSGSTILPLIANLDAYENRLVSIGGVIQERSIRDAENLTDLNNELKRSFESLTAQFSSTFLPAIKVVTAAMRDFTSTTRGALRAVEAIANSNALRSIPFFGSRLSGLVKGVQASGTALTADGVIAPAPSPVIRSPASTEKIDRQIASQNELIAALKSQTSKLAPLAPALQKGSAAQLGFVAQLQRQNQQAKIDAREKQKLKLLEDQKQALLDVKKAIEDGNATDEKEIAIL